MSITVLVRVASSLSVQGKSNHFWTNSLMMVLLSQQEIDVNVNREDFIASDVTSCDYLDDSSISITVCCDKRLHYVAFFGPWGYMVLEGRLILPSWYSTTMMTVFRVRRAARCSSRESQGKLFGYLQTYGRGSANGLKIFQ